MKNGIKKGKITLINMPFPKLCSNLLTELRTGYEQSYQQLALKTLFGRKCGKVGKNAVFLR